ncbi:hypothetical protein PI124_g15246 [Phytophthora idaei]|nr:hypothetical protein PI125_g15232 [Phytophthora idaei]KAG3168906.1 hypothetical protein PI126_g3051 [Phytophthora idaei]KAG3239823.1 hypothetical protein PI124_g15246 [Phytophthora idaei]
MPRVGRDIARALLAVIALAMTTVHADTNVTITSNADTTVTIQQHEVRVLPSRERTEIVDPTSEYDSEHPGRVTIECSSDGLLTIANSSDDGYVQNLRIQYGQAEELYNATTATSGSPRVNLEIAHDGLSGLMNLSSLSLLGINFSTPDVAIALPDTISFIEISATTAEIFSFTASDISSLQEIVLLNNAISTLPKFFYEREYPREALNVSVEWTLPISMELSAVYFANLKANLDKFTGWKGYISLQDSCSNGTNEPNPLIVYVCNNGEALPADSGSLLVDAASGSNTAGEQISGSLTVMFAISMAVSALTVI